VNAPELNVTLPAHNEAAQLAASVRRVVACLAAQPWPWELVIADNGSRDATGAIADQLVAEHVYERTAVGGHSAGVIRARHRAAPGRGAALREAWLGSDAAIVSYLDVDLSTDLACLPALLAPLQTGAADLAIGSRLLTGSQTTRGWKRELISRTYNRLLRTALGLAVHDAQCGFKALTRAAARALLPQVRDDGWFFDTELLVLAQRQGWRTAEVPVRWVDDPGSTVKLASTIWRDLCGVWRLRRAARR
jgi:glycosyltransferase involved in cell wall biosynthesis